jgi:hypothetical protein
VDRSRMLSRRPCRIALLIFDSLASHIFGRPWGRSINEIHGNCPPPRVIDKMCRLSVLTDRLPQHDPGPYLAHCVDGLSVAIVVDLVRLRVSHVGWPLPE